MSDAMILPCGHTFGAGGIEQVKQMVRRLMSFFYSLLYTHGICFFCCCVLLESLLHLFSASLRGLHNPKSQ